jgi:hypothetical protein
VIKEQCLWSRPRFSSIKFITHYHHIRAVRSLHISQSRGAVKYGHQSRGTRKPTMTVLARPVANFANYIKAVTLFWFVYRRCPVRILVAITTIPRFSVGFFSLSTGKCRYVKMASFLIIYNSRFINHCYHPTLYKSWRRQRRKWGTGMHYDWGNFG